MYREMRRIDKQLTMDENIELLIKTEYGFLSTISENGYPYVTPLNYVYYKDCIYFHSAIDGHKIDNINNNEKVAFCIATDVELLPEEFSTKYKSVILFGKAFEVFDDEKVDAMVALIEKYSKPFIEQGKKDLTKGLNSTKVIKIKIDHLSGKAGK